MYNKTMKSHDLMINVKAKSNLPDDELKKIHYEY